MAFHKILVALDPSKTGQAIFDQALDLAKHENSELYLASYLQWTPRPPLDAVSDFSAMPHFDIAALDIETLQIELQRVRTTLTQYQTTAQQAGVKAVLQCDIADPATTICQKAKDWTIDLILLGRRGRTGLSELMMGSISNYVVHHAPCSVLVIQGSLPSP